MDPDYRRRYRELFEQHWWWRARHDVIAETLQRLRPSGGWERILDVGCGDGLYFEFLSGLGREVEGVEPAADVVSDAGGQQERIHIGPFDDSYRPGKRFSLIVMFDVLEHLPDDVAALRRVAQLLEPDGTFVATVPAFMLLWTRHDDLNHHRVRYTKRSLRNAAARAGLVVERSEYFFQWTCPAKLAVRLAQGLLPAPPATPRLPPRWINEGLYRYCQVERGVAKHLSIPFGSSLLVVARRGDGGTIAPR